MSQTDESSSQLSRESVERFVEEKSHIIRDNPDLNEEEAKAAIITDFIRLLGWEIPQDGRMEYQFGDHNTNVVDYAFFHEGSSKLFLEAKSPGTALDGHRSQIKEYLALDNVELGVLTNGKVYEIYRSYVVDDEHVERQQVDRIELDEFPEKLPVLNSLTKADVTSGSYRDQLQRVIDIRNAREALAANEQQLASDIVTLVSETVGTIAQEPARQHVSDYLDHIDDELAPSSDTGTDGPEPEPPTEPEIEMVDDIVIDSLRDEPIFPVKALADLPGNADAKVGVYACDFDRGLPFIAEHNAWGFIRIDSKPGYFSIYLNRPYQQIQLIGRVAEIISKDEFFATHTVNRDPDDVADDKKALLFDELYQLENPIPIGDNPHRMQGLIYTTLGALVSADTTDDI